MKTTFATAAGLALLTSTAAAIPHEPPTMPGNLAVSVTSRPGGQVLNAHISDAWGPRFVVSMATKADGSDATYLASAPLDATGKGVAQFQMPPQKAFTQGDVRYLRGTFLTPAGRVDTPLYPLGMNPPCERLDFDHFADTSLLPAGQIIDDEWAAQGVTISAVNNNGPDAVIIFDSANPTGGDFDLQTPGYGPNNISPQGNLLIIAEDLVDANGDGLVDDPDDDEDGGVITIDFTEPVIMCSLALIDMDDGSIGSVIRFFDGNTLLNTIVLPSIGDNSFQDVVFFERDVTRIEVQLTSSGAIPYISFIPCPADIDFDAQTFGLPWNLPAGTIMSDQFESLGVHFEAFNNDPSHPDLPILFDTANPTGGDTDLQTPGYGANNNAPHAMVLILAEDDVDADGDGLIDDPDDEAAGGLLAIDFDVDIDFRSATVMDVDGNEVSFIQLFDAAGLLVGSFPLANLGDNSVQTVGSPVMGVRRFELHLGGSGALVTVDYCPIIPDTPN